MAFPTPTKTWVAGTVLAASDLNTQLRDALNALDLGRLAMASQAANDFLYASSTTQLARLAAASGVPFFDGSAWKMKRNTKTALTINSNTLVVNLETGG